MTEPTVMNASESTSLASFNSSIEHRRSAVHAVDDHIGHFAVVLADDEHLTRLLVAGHDKVDRVADHRYHDITVNYHRHTRCEVGGEEERRADDEQIARNQYAAVTYTMILVYYHRHDIRTARRAALQESQRDTAAAEYRTQQHQQHVLTVDRAGQHEHHILGDHVLDDIHRQRQHHDTVYR